jgi:hypothetical protein
MTLLSAYGLFAVILMVVTHAAEHRSPWYRVAFAGSCVLGSIYGFLQGAWPFGVVELIWAASTMYRWSRVVRRH